MRRAGTIQERPGRSGCEEIRWKEAGSQCGCMRFLPIIDSEFVCETVVCTGELQFFFPV